MTTTQDIPKATPTHRSTTPAWIHLSALLADEGRRLEASEIRIGSFAAVLALREDSNEEIARAARRIHVPHASRIACEMIDEISGCARGGYQAAILKGWSRWSGSDLKGEAGSFGPRYADSRRALLDRIRSICRMNGWEMSWIKGSARTGAKRLAIRSPEGATVILGAK